MERNVSVVLKWEIINYEGKEGIKQRAKGSSKRGRGQLVAPAGGESQSWAAKWSWRRKKKRH